MATIETWDRFPPALQRHLLERLRDRAITVSDLAQLRQWIELCPTVPAGPWYKDFGSFKLCGEGAFPKTFLLPGQPAQGKRLE